MLLLATVKDWRNGEIGGPTLLFFGLGIGQASSGWAGFQFVFLKRRLFLRLSV
jgi:hypothetical protein